MDEPLLEDGYVLRRATCADADFVVGLFQLPHVKAQLKGPSRDAYLDALERAGLDNFILERTGELLGNVILEFDAPWLLTIRTLAIAKPGLGAGRTLLKGVLDHAFANLRAHRIFLEVRASNEGARKLYESLGFRAEGLYRHGFRDAAGQFHDLVPYGLLETDSRG